eukprot:scaffold47392_cov60-Phaeocystis_antarctica.AAC.5
MRGGGGTPSRSSRGSDPLLRSASRASDSVGTPTPRSAARLLSCDGSSATASPILSAATRSAP